MRNNILKFGIVFILATNTLFSAISNSVDIDLDGLKSASVSSDVDAQLEKIYKDVRTFHIFKPMYYRWGGVTDTFTTLVTGQNGFPVFSARSDKDPKYTDYPIDYVNNTLSRYRPVRPPESVKGYYTTNNISLSDANTSTYHAPIVAAGTIGKGRVLVMGSHLYGSILVNPRNYSTNYSNGNIVDEPDSADMENFFHNVLSWLSEQNPSPSLRYTKTGDKIKILSNKKRTIFWHIGGATYEQDSEEFKIHSKFNLADNENPKLTPTWKEAKANGYLDPTKYPLIIMEDFARLTSYSSWDNYSNRKTALDEVDMLVDYVREGGGLLIMDSPSFRAEKNILETASNEIMKKAGVTTKFANNHPLIALRPNKSSPGGVHRYDMCVLDYIGHTDLQRRLAMSDYSNVPTTLQGLKDVLIAQNKINYLEEVLQRRKRKIFKEGNNASPTIEPSACGTVEIALADGSNTSIETSFVRGDGIVQDGKQHDRYARYPVDLNFAQAQGDVGGSMNTLLSHELGDNKLSSIDVNREYTNMSALLLNDADFTGDKFKSLNELLDEYKSGGRFVNTNGEFYPGFSFSKNDKLDYRAKPVTRIMVERAFYDKNLKYDPLEYPGQTSSTFTTGSATIYLKRNTLNQKWYAGNMQSTGLYAPAHTDITITLPAGVDEKKIQLQIGVGDNVGGIFRHEINLKRPPKYVKKYKFFASGSYSKTITVQHPYGGLIFLKSFDNSKSETDTAEVAFTNIQKSVRFVLGQTTSEQWDTIKNNIAPKAEIESHHYIVTVPRKNMSSLSFADVTRVAQEYDTMARNAYDFYGYDKVCGDTFDEHTPPSCSNGKKKAHKNREVFDPHISIGAGHSGYPIMVMSWSPDSTSFPQDAKNSFLLWHEMGHNMVESWLGIPGATEVANNVMARHQQKRFGIAQSSVSAASIILNKSEPWADGGNAGRLIMFNQLSKWINTNYLAQFKANNTKYYESDGSVKSAYSFLDGDGMDVYKILHREARDKTTTSKYNVCQKQSGKTKTDMLAICTSTILGVNTTPWLQAWKAGTIGIGATNGVNIYDYSGGITNGLNTGVSTVASPAIQDVR